MLFQSCLNLSNGNCPYYMYEVFEFVPEGNISLRNNFLKLKRPFRNINTCQKALSFIGPSCWNQIPETLKKVDNLNTFKHNLKKHFFNQKTWFLLTLSLLVLILLFIIIIIIITSSNIIIIITTVISINIILLLLLVLLLSSIIIVIIFSHYLPTCFSIIFVEGPQWK